MNSDVLVLSDNQKAIWVRGVHDHYLTGVSNRGQILRFEIENVFSKPTETRVLNLGSVHSLFVQSFQAGNPIITIEIKPTGSISDSEYLLAVYGETQCVGALPNAVREIKMKPHFMVEVETAIQCHILALCLGSIEQISWEPDAKSCV
jgi:hypothetical protein